MPTKLAVREVCCHSGRSDLANSSATNLEVPASVAVPTASIAAEPPVAATASKPYD